MATWRHGWLRQASGGQVLPARSTLGLASASCGVRVASGWWLAAVVQCLWCHVLLFQKGWLPKQLCGCHAQLACRHPSGGAVLGRRNFDDSGGWHLSLRGLALWAGGEVPLGESLDDGDARGRRFPVGGVVFPPL